jgi:putative ABC transport system substrate-binding protein
MRRLLHPLLSIGLLLAVLAGAVSVWHPWADDQRTRPLVIAMVQLTDVDARTVAGFKAGMAEAGYRENDKVVYLDFGPVGGIDRLDAVIRDHLGRKPDLFLVSSTPATQAVKRLTEGKGIPVVFAPVNDPLAAGIVGDLRHPGGQITGIRLPSGDDLRLQWLTRIAPRARRIWVPHTAEDASAQATLAAISRVAPGLGIALLPTPVRGADGAKQALTAPPAGIDAIFLPRDSSIESRIDLFAAYALEKKIPLCAPSLTQVNAGALFSYGFVHHDIGRQAARLADQIFKGVKPGDLPVETAESVLSLNLATARQIGIDIPDAILLQAERVIRDQGQQ